MRLLEAWHRVNAKRAEHQEQQRLDEIEASLKRISGTLDVLIYARAAALPPDERTKLLAELDALKQIERQLS